MTLDLPHLKHSPLYNVIQLRSIEQTAKRELAFGTLMSAAAQAATEFVLDLLGEGKQSALILVGPGDNGGDALGVANRLHAQDWEVKLCSFGVASAYSQEAQENLVAAQRSGIEEVGDVASLDLSRTDIVIDGLFGIGLNRAIIGRMADLIRNINLQSQAHQIPLLALDVASGLNADTGQIIGVDGVAIEATHTLTFIGDKPGLHTAKGKDFSGQVFVASLGIAQNFFPPAYAYLIGSSAQKTGTKLLAARKHDSHKGSFGDVLVLGGDRGMVGAPILAARAALYCGAGRVHIGFLDHAQGLDPVHPEIMCRVASKSNVESAVVAIGPGLGKSQEAKILLESCLQQSAAIVIDADALNLIALEPDLQVLLIARRAKRYTTIMTPHPLEAARLLQCEVATIQAQRFDTARQLAQRFQATIILKGAGSIIASPDSPLFINSSGNPALATAGTGDVLAGVCAALLAQGLREIDAATLACFVHGAAADALVKQGLGPIGLSASELMPMIRQQLNLLAASSMK